jgi:hypothetical protein
MRFSVPGWLNPRILLRVLSALDDTPQRIALGTAVGIFIGLTPTVGIQMLLVLLVAPLLPFNRVSALVTVYISNPVTMVPMYYLNYKVGTLFFAARFTYAQFGQVFGARWQESLRALVFEVGKPLVVGSLIVALAAALVTYPSMLWFVNYLRRSSATARRAANPLASDTTN